MINIVVGVVRRWAVPLVLVVTVVAAWQLLGPGPSGEPAHNHGAASCAGAATFEYACHQQRYRELVLGSGVEQAFAALRAENERDATVRDACHYLSHVIGRAAGERYGDVATAYAHGDDFCSSGYYHGVAEGMAEQIGPERIVAEGDTLCAQLRAGSPRSTAHRNCAHGIGHGFMAVLDGDLFASLAACETLGDAWETDLCTGGVFMQNVMSGDDPTRPPRFLDPHRPLYPCTDVAARHKSRCYQKQAAYALSTVGGDFAQGFALCAQAESPPPVSCFEGIGAVAAVHNIKFVTGEPAIADGTRAMCLLGSDAAAQSGCVVGAARTFLHYFTDDRLARAFCATLDPTLHATCAAVGEDSTSDPA